MANLRLTRTHALVAVLSNPTSNQLRVIDQINPERRCCGFPTAPPDELQTVLPQSSPAEHCLIAGSTEADAQLRIRKNKTD